MRKTSLLGLAMVVLFMATTTLTAANQFDGLRFADGKDRSSDDYSKQSLFVVYYCAH